MHEWEGRPVEEWRLAWGLPSLLVFTSVESTNDIARLLAEGGAPGGTTVLTDQQSRGRGQRGREWQAPTGRAVLLSVVLRPLSAGGAGVPGVLPIRVGLAAAAVIEALTGQVTSLKWPNDIMADGGKLGGILCEGALAGTAFSAIAGVGVNVLQSEEELPAGVDPSAVSLAMLGRPAQRPALAGALAAAVAALGQDAVRPLSTAELREFAGRDILRDRVVTYEGAPLGIARGIAADGALLVDGPGGRAAIRSGTIRPADGRYAPPGDTGPAAPSGRLASHPRSRDIGS